MNQIIISDPVAHELLACGGPARLVNQSGETIGLFQPSISSDPELYKQVGAQFNDKEIERRRLRSGGKTTAEVWKLVAESDSPNDAGGTNAASRS